MKHMIYIELVINKNEILSLDLLEYLAYEWGKNDLKSTMGPMSVFSEYES